MATDDIHVRLAAGMGALCPEAEEDIVAAMVEMESIEQFRKFCQANRLGQLRQLRLINDHAMDCYSPQFCEQLLNHRDTIQRNLSRTRVTEPMAAPRHDLMPSSKVAVGGVPPQVPPRTEIRSFCLTPAGDKLSNEQWENMLRGMVALGHLASDAVEGYKILLGLTRRGKHYRPLETPVPFLTSKKTLAFWIAMMYGTHSYLVERPMNYGNGVLPMGLYRCQPLIVVPGGRGPDAEGRTRDPYWQLLQQAVSLSTTRRPARSTSRPSALALRGPTLASSGTALNYGSADSSVMGSTIPSPLADLHSFTTALRPPLDYPTARPILALLRPLGCKPQTAHNKMPQPPLTIT